MKPFSIGVDIGGTNTDIGLVNGEGKCIAGSRISTSQYGDPRPYVDHLAEAILELMKINGIKEITGIGIGVPNGNYYTGRIDNAVNLNFKGEVNLRDMIRERINVPVVVTNDANAAAFGELVYGGAKEMKDFIMITLGTGVGSGIVVNGKLVYGHDGYAGELGHVIIYPGGRSCNCGRKGCLEQYTSSGGIKKTFIELMKKKYGENFVPEDENSISSKYIAALALNGDEIARKTFRITGEILGVALANAVAYTSPEAIFLMGGPVKAGDLLLKPIQKSFEENLLFIYKDKVRIILSHLNENEAAILGAAALTNKV